MNLERKEWLLQYCRLLLYCVAALFLLATSWRVGHGRVYIGLRFDIKVLRAV
jgi:hypothetical protein